MRFPARSLSIFLFLVLALGLGPAAAGEPSSSKFRRGDVNGDASLDISDSVRALEFLFLGEGEVLCRDAADANDDGDTDITDAIAILGFLFLGDEDLPSPGSRRCGRDPTEDDLDCASQAACRSFSFSELVAVEFPPRGAMLTGSPDVAVRGRLTGEAAVASLTLNGFRLEVRADGLFETQVAAQHGLNALRFRAVDRSGEEITAARSFLWADRYQSATSGEEALIPGGLTLHLEQDGLDDRNPDLDDFASLAERELAGFDINGAIPNPLFTRGNPGCACSVIPPVVCNWARGRARNARLSSPDVTATLQAGSIRLSIQVRQISVDLTVDGVIACIGVGPITGKATASSATVSGDLEIIRRIDGTLSVNSSNVAANVVGLDVAIDVEILGGLANAVLDLFASGIEAILKTQLINLFHSQIDQLLEGFLADLGDFSQNLGTTVTLFTRLTGASVNAQRCRLEMSTAFTSPSVLDPRLGSVLSPVVESAAPPAGRGVALGLSHDALNQLLFAFWKATEPPIDASASIPPQGSLTVESLLLEPLLPPVVLPNLQAPWPLRLQVGDLAFQARLRLGDQGLLEVKGFASASLGADVKALDDRIGLEIGSVLELAVEVTESTGDVDSSPSQTAAALELLFPLILGGLGGSALAELELPATDLTVSHGPVHAYGAGNLAAP